MVAFGFMAGGYYNLATAMVFGFITSLSSWEQFWQAIEALLVQYTEHPDLVIKHNQYLEMISWAKYDPNAKINPALPCLMNKGTLDDQGNRAKLPARIYVDDALMLALSKLGSKCNMKLVLAALIKAIFVIMGKPDTAVC